MADSEISEGPRELPHNGVVDIATKDTARASEYR